MRRERDQARVAFPGELVGWMWERGFDEVSGREQLSTCSLT